ncbi:MAG: hypothetical protein NVS3B10_00450 [Polyangiales bacterium]
MTTKDEIEAIRARWSKVFLHVTPADDPTIVGAKEDVERLIALVEAAVAEERAACEAICRRAADGDHNNGRQGLARACANAIAARGQP